MRTAFRGCGLYEARLPSLQPQCGMMTAQQLRLKLPHKPLGWKLPRRLLHAVRQLAPLLLLQSQRMTKVGFLSCHCLCTCFQPLKLKA